MELTKDIVLRGMEWDTAVNQLSSIFAARPIYMVYMLALSIGIMYDERIEQFENKDLEKTVGRNVLRNNDNGKLDLMYQAAILSTSTVDFSEDERLDLAFGERGDFNKIDFLTKFANFGVTKLIEQIGSTPLESMENIKNFLCATVEGRNFDVDDLPDEILLGDELEVFH